MISVNDLRQGVIFSQEGALFQVLEFKHVKLGRGGAIVRVKVKNLNNGATTEKTFKASDSVEEVVIERKKVQFLYSDEKNCILMDQTSFEQFEVPKSVVGSNIKYLKEGMELSVLLSGEKVINLELPIKEVYLVTQTDPGLRGDTVSGGSKPATIETGAVISVPLFIKIGDKIRVNTLEGKYIERVP